MGCLKGFVRRHKHKQIESRSSHGYGYSREEFKELPEEIKDLKEEMMVTNDVMFMLTEELKELTEEIKDLKEEMVVTKDLMSVFTEELKLMVERLREPPQVDEIDIHVSVPPTPELAVEILWSQDGSEEYSCSSPSYESCSDSSSS